jgi:hypothetical protein
MFVRKIGALLGAFLLFTTVDAGAEIITTGDDQQSISLTIYNSNLALIRDTRKITLPTGIETLAFKEISSQIQPETALLKGGGVDVLEQNYEFDLLSPESLLRKYVGKEITLVRTKGDDDDEYRVKARVLSVTGGVVLQIDDHIETALDGRVIYPDVPLNLRERPTLTMVVESDVQGEKELELSYLTQGLSWKADYVAQLNNDENRIDLKGWVTLVNNSGSSYKMAKLQLVAGEVNRAPEPRTMMPMVAEMSRAMADGMQKNMEQESLFEYHLYSVARPTTLLQNQSKQIALLQENNGIVTKELVLRSRNQNYYYAKVGNIDEKVGVDVFLKIKNDKASNFGLPKPAGIVRVYKEDGSGFSQFIGEDSIDHTPENEIIRIKMGKAFDVTADRVQTDFSVVRGTEKNQRIHESAYTITIKNAKPEAVEVEVEEILPGDWEILSESHEHTKKSATTVSWMVPVKAKSSAQLSYRVRQVMN